MRKNIVPLAFGLVLMTVGSTATALERPFTQEKAQVSGHLGGGIYLGDGNLNPYGFGLGARGGYTFNLPIYVGGLMDIFVGEKDSFPAGEAKAHSFIFQGEVGYDLGITRRVVIRPKMGLGLTHFFGKTCANLGPIGPIGPVGGCRSYSDTKFAFQIGAEVPIAVGPVFISPEMRFNIVNDASALFLGAGVGGAF